MKRYDPALFDKPRWLVLNKLDLVPEDERAKRVAAFVKAYRWKGPTFAIAAVNGEGCRELTFAVQAWLDAHPAAPSWRSRRDDDRRPVVVRRRRCARGDAAHGPRHEASLPPPSGSS